jgi:hypothetical protein
MRCSDGDTTRWRPARALASDSFAFITFCVVRVAAAAMANAAPAIAAAVAYPTRVRRARDAADAAGVDDDDDGFGNTMVLHRASLNDVKDARA